MNKLFIPFIIIMISLGNLSAQNEYPYPSLSPKGSLTQIVGNTTIEFEYERPSVRKRKIFGELVPWNKVWRTGAGKCTKISFDQAVKIGGQSVQKGTYSVFTIPNPEEWVIILNRDTSLYGSYKYKPEKDVARFVAIPQKTNRYYETLNFDIEIIPNNAKCYLSWDHTQISFDIETSTDRSIEQFIKEELITGKEKSSIIYAGAAEYYLYQGANLREAISLADQALELDKSNGWARDLKVRIYERIKRYNKALIEIEKALEEVENTEYENAADQQREIESLKKRMQSIKNKLTE